MILLSLALVVVSVGTLVGGLATSSSPLVWTSLAAALAAAALVAGSVARRRTRLPGGTQGEPSLPILPATPPAADGAPPRVPVDLPTAGGVFPGDRFPGPPLVPPTTTPTGSVTQSDQAASSATGVTAGAAEPRERDTPSERDTPNWPSVFPRFPDGGPTDPPATGTAPEGPTDAPSAEHRAQEPLSRSEQLSEPIAEPLGGPGEPPVEHVAIGDALRVAQLSALVTVRDGHPRYHLAGCPTLAGVADGSELPVSVARRSGFTPCGVCSPDRTLLATARPRTPPAS